MSPRDRRRGQTTTIDGAKPVLDGFAMAREANIVNARNQGVSNTELPGRKATPQQSRATFHGNFTPELAGHMGNLLNSGLTDDIPIDFGNDIDTTEGVDAPPKIENLPAILSTAIAKTDNLIFPLWHQVKDLPNYRASAIRALGRQIFGMFTDTPIEDIQCCTTIPNEPGQRANRREEVQAMMAWIKKNGVKNDEMRMTFEELMPGYEADVQAWDAEGFSFVLVKDPSGYFVYAWPGGRGVHLEQEPPRPMLR